MHTRRIAPPNALRHFGAAQRGRQPQLIAAGHEDSIGLIDVVQVFAGLTIFAGFERQHFGMAYAQPAKQFLVIAPGVVEFGGCRNNADARGLAAADIHEAIENLRIVEFFLGPANRDDIAAIRVFDIMRRAH